MGIVSLPGELSLLPMLVWQGGDFWLLLGAVAVPLAALILEARADVPPSFSYYLSTECSVGEHTSPAGVLAFEKQIDGKTLPATLFLAGASGGNHPLIGIPLFDQITSQNLPGLVAFKAEYNTSHVGADVPAFEDALKRFFS